MENKIRTIVLNPNLGLIIREIDNTLEGFKKALMLKENDYLTCVTRTIGGKEYDIWLDDCGLLKEVKQVSALCFTHKEILVGNLLICRSNHSGESTSINDLDIKNIKANLIKYPHSHMIEYEENYLSVKKDQIVLCYDITQIN